MNESTATLFDEFAAAYRHGDAPDVLFYLDRAGADADALADLIDRFLQAVPAREPTEEEIVLAHARLEHEPALLALRKRRRLTRDTVVDALIAAIGLDTSKSGKVKSYYSDLEVGVLDPNPVDRRVWDALQRILSANVRVLAGLRPPPAVGPAAAYRRASSGIELHERVRFSIDAVSESKDEAAVVDSSVADADEVDLLFTGNA